MRGYASVDPGYSGAGSGEIEEFLEAAEELERQLDAESGVVLRQLTEILRRQAAFQRLNDRFGVPAIK